MKTSVVSYFGNLQRLFRWLWQQGLAVLSNTFSKFTRECFSRSTLMSLKRKFALNIEKVINVTSPLCEVAGVAWGYLNNAKKVLEHETNYEK
ncbi:MAG: hypothetical protein VXZ25_07600 [Pseudomonadota bacterium]|nr:hypothetical protein [Pseudomonadota bacterium]